MGKLFSFAAVVATVYFIVALVFNPFSTQSAPKGNSGGKPIPAAVMKIAEKSCVKCHVEPGNHMALAHVNLSNWDKYSPEKQADKAIAMCNMVMKDKMPPKKFRENNPNGIPSKEELKTICDWAESIRITKK